MDKVMSARLSEEAIAELDRASKKLGMTKKQFLEEAIHLRAETNGQKPEVSGDDAEARRQRERERRLRILHETFGFMVRDEPPEETIRQMKESWSRAYQRHWEEIDQQIAERS